MTPLTFLDLPSARPVPSGRAFDSHTEQGMRSIQQTYSQALNGWLIVVRIELLAVEGYAESSPFAVAVEDQDSAIEIVRQAYPFKEGLEFAAVAPLSARDLAVLGLREGEFRARWKRIAVGDRPSAA